KERAVATRCTLRCVRDRPLSTTDYPYPLLSAASLIACWTLLIVRNVKIFGPVGRSGRVRAAGHGTAGQAHKDTHTDCNCDCNNRPMLDLVRQAAQCIVRTGISRLTKHGAPPLTRIT